MRKIEDQLIENMGHSLSWICMGVLEGKTDEFGFKTQKLNNLFDFVQEEKRKWNLDQVDTAEIIAEAKGKREHVYEACKQVPFSQLLNIAEVKGRQSSKNPLLKQYLQCGYCIIGVWLDTVLQEHYRMSLVKRKQVFSDMNNWIDSYQKGYLSNRDINQMFIEDIGYDLEKGEKVNA